MSTRIAVRLLFGAKTASTEDVAFGTSDGAAIYAMMNPGNRGVYIALTENSDTLESTAKEFFLRDAVKYREGEYTRQCNHIPGQQGASRIIDVVLTEEDVQAKLRERYAFYAFRMKDLSPGPPMYECKSIGMAVWMSLRVPGIGFWCRERKPADPIKREMYLAESYKTAVNCPDMEDRLQIVDQYFGPTTASDGGPSLKEFPGGTTFFAPQPNPPDKDGMILAAMTLEMPDGTYAFVKDVKDALRACYKKPHTSFYCEFEETVPNTFTLQEWIQPLDMTRYNESILNIDRLKVLNLTQSTKPFVGFCLGDDKAYDAEECCIVDSKHQAMALALRKPGYFYFVQTREDPEALEKEFQNFKDNMSYNIQPRHAFSHEKMIPRIILFRKPELKQKPWGFLVGRGNHKTLEMLGTHVNAMSAALANPGTTYVVTVTYAGTSEEADEALRSTFLDLQKNPPEIDLKQFVIRPFYDKYRYTQIPGPKKEEKKMHTFALGIGPFADNKAQLVSGSWHPAVCMAIKNPGQMYAVSLDISNAVEISNTAKAISEALSNFKGDEVRVFDFQEPTQLDTIEVNSAEMTVVTLSRSIPKVNTVVTHTALKTGDPAFNQEEMSVTKATGAQRSRDADDFAYHLFHPCVMDRLAEVISDEDEQWFAAADIEERLDGALRSIFRWLGGDDSKHWLEHAAINMLLAMESQESGQTAALNPALSDVAGGLQWGYLLFPPRALARIAKVWRTGANRYGAHNYERGMYAVECLNHGVKHIYDYIVFCLYKKETGCDDLAHVVCNLFMASQSWEFHPELNRGTRRGEGSTLTSDIIAKQEAFNFLKRHRDEFESQWDGLSRSDLTGEGKLKCCLAEFVPGKATRAGIEEVVRARLFEESRVG